MKYLALLRGINVGGNSIIKMADLKAAVEKIGFNNVKTYIQSGNVFFESENTDKEELTEILQKYFLINFNLDIPTIVLSDFQLEKVLEGIPDEWNRTNDLRCYIAFIKIPTTPDDVLKEIELKEGIDFVKSGPGVLYMSTKLSGLTKSRFSRLAGKPVYRYITMRNITTVRKLFSMLKQ